MNIFLVGFMGSGKSTVGKQLSKELNMQFIDLDNAIEQKEGKIVSEIFSQSGEQKFREMEKNMIGDLSLKTNQVIALGGGAPCFFNNMEQINKTGFTVYLKMSAGAIHERLINLPEKARLTRPLIANKTSPELLDYIVTTLNKREPFYSKAKCIVSNEGDDITATIGRIKTALEYYPG